MISVSTQIAQEDSLVAFARMLSSVTFADEIVVHNMGRTDQEFVALAAKCKARVVGVATPHVVEEIRTQEVLAAKSNWVLILDYDEVVTVELASEILAYTHNPPATYALKRRNYSLGWPLKRGGFGDDYVPRLFHKSLFIAWPIEIHSLPQVRGAIVRTTHYLEHHKDESLTQMVDKTNRYSDVESKQFLDGSLPPVTSFTLIRKWLMESFRRGILKYGLLDGKIGVLQSLYQGFSVFVTYAKLYEKQTKVAHPTQPSAKPLTQLKSSTKS